LESPYGQARSEHLTGWKSRIPSIGCAGGRRVGRLDCGLGKINLPAEDGVVFNGEAEGADVAFHDAAGAQLNAAAGYDVAVDLAENNDVTGGQIGGYVGRGADG
jgi:hypothetical protein